MEKVIPNQIPPFFEKIIDEWYPNPKDKFKLFGMAEECMRAAVAYERKQQETFEGAVRPAIKFLAENQHPHTKIIIESNSAELVEGVKAMQTDEYLVD